MRTTWNATVTVLPSAHTMANATSYTDDPSVVLTANAWLSPAPGGPGRLNGKTHAGRAAVVPPRAPPLGTRTSASSGWRRVGGVDVEAHTVRGALTTCPSRSWGATTPDASSPSMTAPRSKAWIGRYRLGSGHQA